MKWMLEAIFGSYVNKHQMSAEINKTFEGVVCENVKRYHNP